MTTHVGNDSKISRQPSSIGILAYFKTYAGPLRQPPCRASREWASPFSLTCRLSLVHSNLLTEIRFRAGTSWQLHRTTVMLRKLKAARPAAFAAIMMFAAMAVPTVAHAVLTYTIGGTWDTVDRQNAAAAAMQLVVNRFNAYGDFGNYNIYVYYNSGIPTAQASYLGSIGFGGTWPAERVAEHESCHYLGTGTTSAWSGLMVGGQWQGLAASTLIQQFDGIGAVPERRHPAFLAVRPELRQRGQRDQQGPLRSHGCTPCGSTWAWARPPRRPPPRL